MKNTFNGENSPGLVANLGKLKVYSMSGLPDGIFFVPKLPILVQCGTPRG
jgi:hypothetical protein